MKMDERSGGHASPTSPVKQNGLRRAETSESGKSDKFNADHAANGLARAPMSRPPAFEPQVGYRQWVAQAGTLIADLLTCAGADHVITMDLHGA